MRAVLVNEVTRGWCFVREGGGEDEKTKAKAEWKRKKCFHRSQVVQGEMKVGQRVKLEGMGGKSTPAACFVGRLIADTP
jgi:hypothetical protein